MNIKKINTRKQWSDTDVNQCIALYLSFLDSQQHNEAYTKAKPVRELAELQGRSKGSIECKLMNISAACCALNMPYVKGYKPLVNYNKALEQQILDYIK